MPSAVPDPLRPGSVVGPAGAYRILEELPAGDQARVFVAERAAGGARGALKVLDADADADARRRFARERELTARLAHPNLVRLVDAAPLGDEVPAFVVELLVGADLAELLRHRGPFSPAASVAVVAAAARGLAAAHAVGVIHGDVRPENLFVARDAAGERVVLLDFGHASTAGEPWDPPPASPYACVERRCGAPAAPAHDIHALGAVWAELLRGRRGRLAPPFAPSASPELEALLGRMVDPGAGRLRSLAAFPTELAALPEANADFALEPPPC